MTEEAITKDPLRIRPIHPEARLAKCHHLRDVTTLAKMENVLVLTILGRSVRG